MNGRAMYREYAKSQGKEAKEFVEIKSQGYGANDILITKSESGSEERTSLVYQDVVNFIIKTY
jgi:hypothetical protein